MISASTRFLAQPREIMSTRTGGATGWGFVLFTGWGSGRRGARVGKGFRPAKLFLRGGVRRQRSGRERQILDDVFFGRWLVVARAKVGERIGGGVAAPSTVGQ